MAEELFSSGYVDNNPSNPGMGGPGNVKRSVADWRRAFPDTMNRFGDVLDGGDLVAAYWATRGTHRREFLGLPATGWRIEMTSGGVFRVEGGKVAESWDLFDALGLLRRLGTKPRPEGGR